MLQLKTAEERLRILGAIKNEKATPLGKVIAKFPVLPRFGKMLALSHQYDLLPYTICLVAALSVQEVLLETPIGQNNHVEDIKSTREVAAHLTFIYSVHIFHCFNTEMVCDSKTMGWHRQLPPIGRLHGPTTRCWRGRIRKFRG